MSKDRGSTLFVCDMCGHRHWFVRPPKICPQPRCYGQMVPAK